MFLNRHTNIMCIFFLNFILVEYLRLEPYKTHGHLMVLKTTDRRLGLQSVCFLEDLSFKKVKPYQPLHAVTASSSPVVVAVEPLLPSTPMLLSSPPVARNSSSLPANTTAAKGFEILYGFETRG
ncbi:hypothetical protein QVD17_40398 [Tagetes erecta]|uniref:Uncharacterized protein n=1 Tax=Tagetes erecta TaxID=13708 RepID=A0AAD8JTS2_TARER|nr:hypothetical protein QVD17_40398 [Tagetes erecta]